MSDWHYFEPPGILESYADWISDPGPNYDTIYDMETRITPQEEQSLGPIYSVFIVSQNPDPKIDELWYLDYMSAVLSEDANPKKLGFFITPFRT